MKHVFILIILTGMLLIFCNRESSGPKDEHPVSKPDITITAYLPDYEVDAFNTSPCSLLTDLILFSIEPVSDGGLDTSRFSAAAIAKLKATKALHGIRLCLGVGGWDRSSGFAEMVADSISRHKFIGDLLEYCKRHGFDGVDFDWEFPENSAQISSYAVLIRETKQAFSPEALLVTAALSPDQSLSSEGLNALDRVHIMSYDHSGQHSTYDHAVQDVQGYRSRAVPAGKLCLGVPFYARHTGNFSLSMSYSEIVELYSPDADVDLIDGYYFNGISTMQHKTEFACNQQLCGIMIWEVALDAPGSFSLLQAIYDKALSLAN